MLDLKWIRCNPDQVKKAIEVKKIDFNLSELLETDQALLKLRKKLQLLEEEKNSNAKKVPLALSEERTALIAHGKSISQQIEALKPQIFTMEQQLQQLLWLVPNLPAPEAPEGSDEKDNRPISSWGTPRVFDFPILDHVQLLEKHHWAEFERITQVSGSRTYALKDEMVLLELALQRLALETLRHQGFHLITVPAMAREFAFYGTGHFPTGKDQAYYLSESDLYLAGTAEVLLNSLHSKEILAEKDLPLLYAGFSPCFRKEAGSAGKDTRGLMRVHQFMKVEQFVICQNDPEISKHWHHQLLNTSEALVQALELPYRIVDICTGDMGPGKIRQFDLETWVPSENQYRETHSCSTLHDWQARRIELRYRDLQGKVHYCHTLNNTAIATPRILVSFLENHQTREGDIRIPQKLQPYLGGLQWLTSQPRKSL